MPKNNSIKKVLVIGSGPIVIGQAAEFDYAGTQACRSLKEEGIEVVLVNSNPATIMTDKQIADKVYIEPLTTEVLKKIIKKEEPDSILPTLGGQAALNLAMELDESGFLVENRVRMIGTSSQTIKKAEDRLAFKETMEKIGEPCAASEVCTTLQGCFDFAEKNGYPVVIRPAYTLGGSGLCCQTFKEPHPLSGSLPGCGYPIHHRPGKPERRSGLKAGRRSACFHMALCPGWVKGQTGRCGYRF